MQLKKIILTFLSICACTLKAQEPAAWNSIENENMATFCKDNFLEDNYFANELCYIAEHTLKKNNSLLTTDELLKAFKSYIQNPEVAQEFADIYANEFENETKFNEIFQFLQNSSYLKYRQTLKDADYKCINKSSVILNKLAQTLSPKIPNLSLEEDSFIYLTQENMEAVLNDSRPVIIDVYTQNCAPCRLLAPIFKELAETYGHLYQFVKLNAEEEGVLTEALNVHGFPTIIFFKKGKEVGRQMGFMNKEKFSTKIKFYLE